MLRLPPAPDARQRARAVPVDAQITRLCAITDDVGASRSAEQIEASLVSGAFPAASFMRCRVICDLCAAVSQ
jgi:hypothetical protein